jgi:uroporphyrinogen-III synthase
MTSEELREQGFSADFEPAHPKMGFLVNEAAQRGAEMLELKRGKAAG